jgi:hypothetical protein
MDTHRPYIIVGTDRDFHQVRCDTEGCTYEGPEFDGRRYLAELNASEHVRACIERPDFSV